MFDRAMARVLLTCLFSLLLPALPSRAQERVRSVRTAARVIATAGISGRFGEARCSETESVVPHEAAVFTAALVGRAEGPEALAIDTGGLLAPHGVTRFANRDLPAAVAELVRDLGYEALAFGENDLGAPRARTLTVARALGERGVPYVATNLACEENPLCEAIVDASDPPSLFSVGSERAAFLAFLDPQVLERVAPDRVEGLSVAPIEVSLPAAVRAAREAGATLVVAVLDLPSDDAFALARGLPEDGRPDLVFLADAGIDLLFARPASVVPAIVSPPPGSGVEVHIGRSDELTLGFEMLAEPLSQQLPPGIAAAVHRFTDAVGPGYCAAWGRALPGGHLDRGIDPPSVAELSARIIREFAGADVAFFNLEAIDGTFRAADPRQLSASDFYIAIEFDEPLVVAEVSARWLREAFDQATSRGVLMPGLASTGTEVGSLRIRGRPPVTGATYRVVTLRFLAEGGDDALPELPDGTTWRTLEHEENGVLRYESLRDVVLRALEGPDPRDPRDARPSPNDAPEWVLGTSLDGDFAGSSTDNPVGYDAALLATETAIAMGLSIDLWADASAPDWSWESRLTGSFRTQWSPSTEPGVAGQFIEAQDRLQLHSLLSYRGFRSDPTAVYIPDFYLEAFVESELTQPEGRDFHWLLLRPTIGARFAFTTELEVKLQAGVQGQALQMGSEAEFGAGAAITLNPWTVFSEDERSLTVEGDADFFCADLFDQNRWQLRSQLDLALDLAGPLALTFGATLYMQEEAAQGVGLAFAATAGLRVAAVTRVVGP